MSQLTAELANRGRQFQVRRFPAGGNPPGSQDTGPKPSDRPKANTGHNAVAQHQEDQQKQQPKLEGWGHNLIDHGGRLKQRRRSGALDPFLAPHYSGDLAGQILGGIDLCDRTGLY